jgi:bifunctional non-homologous end joining protein LigD
MPEKLSEYNQKRNFGRTLEPEGEVAAFEGRLRFVVQHHMARRDHYDFRLEWGGALLSWAVPRGPSYDTRDKRLAVRVEDHPLEYRNFEGTIPKGEYGGGAVMLWDEGTWEPLLDVEKGLREGSLKFQLKGRRLKGRWALVRMKAKEGATKDNWLLLKERDGYVRDADGISEFTTSVRTGRTMAEIEAGEDEKNLKNPISRVDVQLARLVHAVPEGEDWLYELKYDGYRIVAFVEGDGVRLVTRNGNDYTDRFPSVADSLSEWASGRAMVLDGEMVITDAEGRTDFQALQNHLRNPEGKNPTYIAFDLLALDGEDLRERPLIQRKEALEALLKGAPENLYYSKHVRGNGKDSFLAACGAQLEGIIGKKADSVYSGTRNGDWVKLKCGKRQAFVIGGYTLSDKRSSGVSSLLLGIYMDGALIYAGRAGTGFSETNREILEKKLEGIRRPEPPFKLAPKPRPNEKITWLEPEMVAEVHFAEWTEENLLRQASFKGLRTDVYPRTVTMEGADKETRPQSTAAELEKPMQTNGVVIEGVKITNPGKVLFEDPVVTKEDVVRYYADVSEHMLPYVRHRVLSIVRCPKGVSQACFYKKHPGPDSKGIVVIPVSNSDGDTEDYFYIEDAPGLISEAQMGTLEFHTWGSRVETLEKPDVMVFDLDPDEGMDLATVRQGVRDIKGVLDELSLLSYLKTSGGKGYHVVVPLQPAATWDAFHDFAKRVAEVMEQKWPDRYTSNVRKVNRKNRIFIDWIRNGRGATSIAPYSIRARKGARVSMPIAWDELDAVAPDGVTMADALARIRRGDPWKGFFQNHQLLR